jgi:hypothetical protein
VGMCRWDTVWHGWLGFYFPRDSTRLYGCCRDDNYVHVTYNGAMGLGSYTHGNKSLCNRVKDVFVLSSTCIFTHSFFINVNEAVTVEVSN